MILGTQGRVLSVLAETTAELNLRTLARLASVSPAQTSLVLLGLVELGRMTPLWSEWVPPRASYRFRPRA